jgi:hypothetical protein
VRIFFSTISSLQSIFFFGVSGPETIPLILSALDVLSDRTRETANATGKRDAIGLTMMRKEGEVVAETAIDLTATGLVKDPVETRTGKETETGVVTVMAIVETKCETPVRVGTVIVTVTATAKSETGDESAVMM